MNPTTIGQLTPTTVGALYLVTAGLLLLLLREPLRRFEMVGSKGFALTIFAIALWPLSEGINALVPNRGASMMIWNLRLFAASLVSIGWFLLAYEFRTQRLPPKRVLVALAAYLLVGGLAALSNPIHGLILTPETTVVGGILVPAFGRLFWVLATINYGLILAASALLTAEWYATDGRRRRQSFVLAVAVVPPVVANLATLFEVVDVVYDLTPVGLVGSGLLLSWALYRMRVLEVVPVGREIAVEGMDDALVILDDDDRVLDCNEAARELFGVDAGSVGSPAIEFFESVPDELLERCDGASVQSALTTALDGERRHFSLSVSPILSTRESVVGRVVVLRDVTTLKHREQELDLFRQVLTRVLRHDLRTEVNKIQGHAAMLAEENGSDQRVEAILDACDTLVSRGEKARDIDRIVQATGEVKTYDLRRIVDSAVCDVGSRHQAVRFVVDGPESRPIRTTPGVGLSVENLIENAAEHAAPERADGGAHEVRVSIATEGDATVLTIADDGPGIPEYELDVLEERKETPLSHGSGIGLWLVDWWADRANATLSFESGDDGTLITVRFPEPGAPA